MSLTTIYVTWAPRNRFEWWWWRVRGRLTNRPPDESWTSTSITREEALRDAQLLVDQHGAAAVYVVSDDGWEQIVAMPGARVTRL